MFRFVMCRDVTTESVCSNYGCYRDVKGMLRSIKIVQIIGGICCLVVLSRFTLH